MDSQDRKSEASDARSAEEIFEQVKALMRRSDYLRAYDLATHGVALYPDHVGLRHRGVLALARIGVTSRATLLFSQWALNQVTDDEDVLALRGRLIKDAARSQTGPARVGALVKAADAYERAFEVRQGYFPAINVASLFLMAGDRQSAHVWASMAAARAEKFDDYYSHATIAEACLVLGEFERASDHLAKAVVHAKGDFAAMSTTRAQLSDVMTLLDADPIILDALRPPAVSHYCGHMPTGPGGRFPESEHDRVVQEIRAVLGQGEIGFMFGSLAAGADIVVAETAIKAGKELVVVLPFESSEFVEVSVRPAGEQWVARFDVCMEQATDTHYVTDGAYLGHDELFNYASHLALGLASLRSQMLGAELRQLAVWDGEPPRKGDAAGTAYDLARGRAMGLSQHIVKSKPWSGEPSVHALTSPPADGRDRQRRTMIFGDLKGFSKLKDQQLPDYVDEVLGVCARTLAEHETHLLFRNTWGDGLFLVFDDLPAAADCAFALQEAVGAIDRRVAGLPETLGLRLGLHYGPVFEKVDPVLGRTNYFGYHVSRAARVEPITPEGEVYVTDSAAAALAVDAPDQFRCNYVGRLPLAKGYGEFPMYALTRHDRH